MLRNSSGQRGARSLGAAAGNQSARIIAAVGVVAALTATAWVVAPSGSGHRSSPRRVSSAVAEKGKKADSGGATEGDFLGERAYPHGPISATALLNAEDQLHQVSPFDVTNLSFRPIGPHPIATSPPPNNLEAPVSGRVSRIAPDPKNANIAYAGSANGGVWKTIDAGKNWTPIFDGEPSLSIGAVTVDTTNSAVVYVGTGEGDKAESDFGAGVFKSTNAGATWTKMGGTVFDNCSFSDLATKPGATATVYAAVNFCDAGAGPAGLYRSTNAGLSWFPTKGFQAEDISIDPLVPGNVWVAGVGAVYKSVDSGANWSKTLLPAFPGRSAIASAPSDANRVYAILGDTTQGGGNLQGIYTSSNGGASWTQITNVPAPQSVFCYNQCTYDMALVVDPLSPGTFYAGGIYLLRYTGYGASYSQIATTIQNGVLVRTAHPDFHSLAFSGTRLWVGNDGGVNWANSPGQGLFPFFVNANADLELTQFYRISGRGGPGGPIVGGTQDNGNVRYGGSAAWNEPLYGDGGYTATDATNPLIMYSNYLYFDSFQRSDDGGLTWHNVNAGNQLCPAHDCLSTAPIAAHPTLGNVLYAGDRFVRRSVNGGVTWTNMGAGSSSQISAIGVGAPGIDTVYAGIRSGGISSTFNGGKDWTFSAVAGASIVTDIVVNPQNAREAYATVSDHGTGHLWQTINGGVSWTNRSGNLPDVPTFAVAKSWFTNTLYVATWVGLMRSTDGGNNWMKLASGIPNVPVTDLLLDPVANTLTAATYGRGAFQASIVSSQTFGLHVTYPGFDGQVTSKGTPVANPISCGGFGIFCDAVFPGESGVQLTATAGAGKTFVGWTGACTGTSPTCLVTMNASKSVTAVFSPNKTLFWYQPNTGTAFTSTLKKGVYTPGKTLQFRTGWTNIAISRDTAMFYNATEGRLDTGVMLDGTFKQTSDAFTGTGFTNLAATCDSAVLFQKGGLGFYAYPLHNGTAAARKFFLLTGAVYDTVVASCDSVLFYNSQYGFGVTGTLKNGVWTQVAAVTLSAGWNRVVASDDSIFFMNTANEHQAYGTFAGGRFVQTGHATSAPACADDRFAATGDSLLDMRVCSSGTTALTGAFVNGQFVLNPKVLFPNPAFTILAGGR